MWNGASVWKCADGDGLMKRVLHISKYYAPFVGGTEQVARDAVIALAGCVEQKVLCFNHEPSEKRDIVDGVEIIRCHCEFKCFSQSISLCFGKVLRSVIAEFNPDIIIFHYPNPYAAYFLLKEMPKHVKLYVYWHLDITRQKFLGKFFHLQNLTLLRRAEKVIATSPNYVEGSKYLNRVKRKCFVIPNCIDENRLSVSDESLKLAKKIKSENNGKILCLAVGRHVPYKGFEYLIKACKKLDDRFVVHITGEGELTKDLKKLAADDPKVSFVGKVDDVKLKAYYLASDIFCFSSISKNEAFGVALAEAMYFGLPSVTFTIEGSGVNYVSEKNVTGIEVENGNVQEYANAMNELANDEKLRKRLGLAAKARVDKMFLIERFRKMLRELLLKDCWDKI